MRIFCLASSLRAEAAGGKARDPFIREIVGLLEGEAEVASASDLEAGADAEALHVAICGQPGPDYGSLAADMIYIRTGGTEGAFKAAFTTPEGQLALPSVPFLLLTSGKSNSLAASMEILSFLRMQGCVGEILHGAPDYVARRIRALATGHPSPSDPALAQEIGENMRFFGESLPNAQKISKNMRICNEKLLSAQEMGEILRSGQIGRSAFDAEGWKARLAGKRLGLVGRPSDWLISSDVDPEVARRELGLELIDIPMAELIAEIRQGGYDLPRYLPWPSPTATPLPSPLDSTAPSSPTRSGITPGPITAPFQPRFGRTLTPEAFEAAMDIYGALCRIVTRYRLDGLTLRCFDLLTAVGNTGCMALAILNAQGIPSSCEGDVPALISMFVARELSGCSGFQANPARIDPQRGEILLAHCTVPLDMIRFGEYDTHFESGIGVAVRGELPEGPVTVFKISPDLSQCFAADAVLVRNLAERELCRTQVLLRAPGTDRYFLTDSIGNHHIIIPGHHAAALDPSRAGAPMP